MQKGGFRFTGLLKVGENIRIQLKSFLVNPCMAMWT